MSVAAVIDKRAWTVTHRTASGSYDQVTGEYSEANATKAIQAIVSPVDFTTSGAMLQNMAEGVRAEATDSMWTRSAIAVDDEIIDGAKSYRVLHVWDRSRGGEFFKALLGLQA